MHFVLLLTDISLQYKLVIYDNEKQQIKVDELIMKFRV